MNMHWFDSMQDAKEKIEAWRIDYNESRPHQALQDMTPMEFAEQARVLRSSIGQQQPEN
jgi:putative transposase